MSRSLSAPPSNSEATALAPGAQSHVLTRSQESHRLTRECACYAITCMNNTIITQRKNSSVFDRSGVPFFFFFWTGKLDGIEVGCNQD